METAKTLLIIFSCSFSILTILYVLSVLKHKKAIEFLSGHQKIVVATKSQIGSCGKISVYQGAIMKLIDGIKDDYGDVKVYRNKHREQIEDYSWVKASILRDATDEEAKAYKKGIKNIAELYELD